MSIQMYQAGTKVIVITKSGETITGTIDGYHFDDSDLVVAITINNNMPLEGVMNQSSTLTIAEIASIVKVH